MNDFIIVYEDKIYVRYIPMTSVLSVRGLLTSDSDDSYTITLVNGDEIIKKEGFKAFKESLKK